MIKTYKLELDLTEGQIAILNSQSKIANNLYNFLLGQVQEEMNHYKQFKEKKSFNIFSKFDLRNQVPKIKKQHPIYNTLYSSVSKNIALQLANSISSWKKSLKTNHYIGVPKFRSIKEKRFFSLLYEDPFVGYKVTNKILTVNLGFSFQDGKKIPIKLDLKFKKLAKFDFNLVKTLRITCDKEKYFANLTAELPNLEKKTISRIIALDPNHKNLSVGYDSSGNIIEFQNLYFIKILDKRIDQLKTRRDQCKKGSRKFISLNQKVLKLYQIKREQIQVGLRTISNYLCKNYDLIAIGNYVPKAMKHKKEDLFGETKKKRNINKAMMNQSPLGEFRTVCNHICDRSGKTFYKYDEKNTTRTCSECRMIGEKIEPSIREWTCLGCNFHHIRDENAAKNGYKITKEKLPCSGHLDLKIKSRWACKFNGRKLILNKQEIKNTKENCISGSA